MPFGTSLSNLQPEMTASMLEDLKANDLADINFTHDHNDTAPGLSESVSQLQIKEQDGNCCIGEESESNNTENIEEAILIEESEDTFLNGSKTNSPCDSSDSIPDWLPIPPKSTLVQISHVGRHSCKPRKVAPNESSSKNGNKEVKFEKNPKGMAETNDGISLESALHNHDGNGEEAEWA
mmetsp:Transcript_13264/g.19831  ORF Transcript_13264/g.19831 Transcript_13264/m.19831 type:complete len:180 (+) Transcript_13264:287-826(+)